MCGRVLHSRSTILPAQFQELAKRLEPSPFVNGQTLQLCRPVAQILWLGAARAKTSEARRLVLEGFVTPPSVSGGHSWDTLVVRHPFANDDGLDRRGLHGVDGVAHTT